MKVDFKKAIRRTQILKLRVILNAYFENILNFFK